MSISNKSKLSKEVNELVEETQKIANDVIATFKWRHYSWLQQFGINTIKNAKIEFYDNNEIIVNGKIKKVDSLIIATPRKSVQDLLKEH